MRNSKLQSGVAGRTGGFSLVEIAISLFVATMALLVTMLVAGNMTDQLHREGLGASAMDNARAAVDEITRTLRGAGSGTDYANGQTRFLYAGPFTVALNANLTPADDPTGTAVPRAVDPALGGAAIPLAGGVSWTPPRSFGTGAETIILTFDSDRDGSLTTADASDDEEEESENPRDYVLKSFVYGSDGAANTVTPTGLAVLHGPVAGVDGNLPEPLFRYWIDADNDPSTRPVLHGDADADGSLSSPEIAALTPVDAGDLALIERVDIAATAESDKPQHGDRGYTKNVLRSSVSFRNRTGTAARIAGKVFHDVNRNGMQEVGEVPLKDVVIRTNTNYKTKTDVNGRYLFVLNPGVYTITEVDPAGYSSTTPNLVSVDAVPGDYTVVDFGDVSSLGSGRILGAVYDDANKNGLRDAGEKGLPGRNVFLDTGTSMLTDALGRYQFTVQTKDYTVTQVDSAQWTSSTPNVVAVNLTADGDSAVVDFGDYLILDSGKIKGIVYSDTDNDGVRDAGESGIPNVTITLNDERATTTDANGEFSFTAPVGWNKVTELDPPGHTSSTVNVVWVWVVLNTTHLVAFGDIGAEDVSFQEIALGSTERALSITSLDTGEDNRSDADIVLGTHYVGGLNDILAWWNGRTNSSTPNSALFTVAPSFQRVVDSDVNAVVAYDFSGDGRQDLVTGHGTTSNNIAVWVMEGSGITKGQLPSSPTVRYSASLATRVNDVLVGDFDNIAGKDLAVGTRTTETSGKLEVWHGSGTTFTRDPMKDIYTSLPGSPELVGLGDVYTMAARDFTGDGIDDLVLGMRTGTNASTIALLYYEPSKDYRLATFFVVTGLVNDVLALDMKEDDKNDTDIVLALATSETAGRVEVWHNRGDNTFGYGSLPGVTPDDTADPEGAPLSLAAARIDNDVFPDLMVGTRQSTSYTGQVLVYRAFGWLPSQGELISTSGVGEVITMSSADFNKDGSPDLATGTRTSGSAGKVVIYFSQRPAL